MTMLELFDIRFFAVSTGYTKKNWGREEMRIRPNWHRHLGLVESSLSSPLSPSGKNRLLPESTMLWLSMCYYQHYQAFIWSLNQLYTLSHTTMALYCFQSKTTAPTSSVWLTTGQAIKTAGGPGPWFCTRALCYDFNRSRLYSRDRSQSVSDNAQAYVQGAS